MTADGKNPLALAKGFVRAPRLVIFDTTLDPSARLAYLAVVSKRRARDLNPPVTSLPQRFQRPPPSATRRALPMPQRTRFPR